MDRYAAEPGLFMSGVTGAAIAPRTLDALKAAHPEGRHTLIFGPDDFSEEGLPSVELTNQFNAIGFDQSSEIGMAIGEVLPHIAGTGVAIAGSKLALRMEQFVENACIITLPLEGGQMTLPNDHTYDLRNPTDYLTGTLGVDPLLTAGENIPGKGNDMQTWTAHHESDHCRNMTGPYSEYRSDTYANEQYAKDLMAGRVQDPEIPYFMRTQRAAMQVLGLEGDHYTETAVSALAGEKPLTDAQLEQAGGEVGEARNRIYESILDKTGMDMHDIPDDPDLKVARARTIYTEAKLMDQQGAFDDLPYGQDAVGHFIDGAERYGHALYDVRPEHQIDTAPELPVAAPGTVSAFDFKAQVLQDLKF